MPCPVSVLQVAVPAPLPRLFDYLDLTDGRPAQPVGCRVRVPFGRRELTGIVVGQASADSADGLKPLAAWLDAEPLLAGELLSSLHWLARYTHAPPGEVLATALPAGLRDGQPAADTRSWGWQRDAAADGARLRAGGRPQRLAALLGDGGVLAEEQLDTLMDDWRAAARELSRRGLARRVPLQQVKLLPAARPGPPLNPEQQQAVAAITAAQGFAPFLLDGVTGSGKTEVYLQAIAACLAAGRQALVLVPEIGLTPQTLERFRQRLGVPVHTLHSGMADGARTQAWLAAARGQARVVLGTRSAVFTPLPEAGLLIVDEEHDASYKQQDGLRYHARDFALVRAKALGVPVVLGSATPALETLHNARTGRYAHLRLRQRAVADAQPPRVRIMDMRKRRLHDGLSEEALAGIGQHVAAGGQVLVFKNRRGYAPALLCHDCGWTAPCLRCDRPLTVHGAGRRLQCHHCGARQSAPLACPACGGLALQPQGVGTERLEERLLQHFPDVPVVRIDRGTTARRDALEQALAELGQQPGILVGTQILAKGHDLPRLTLVVVVGIDEGLFSADFRASEKLAQQLIQVAGRAGRAERPGEVWLQTHHPGHPLLQVLVSGGYHAFADSELEQRQAAGFPPYAHLALLRAEAQQVEQANAFLLAVRAMLPAATGAVEHYGPMPAPMPRRAGYQRTQLLLSCSQRAPLQRLLDAVVPAIHALPEARRVRWSLDVDPIDLY